VVAKSVPLMLQIEKCREWDQWIEKAFAAMDKSGTGRLSRDDLAAYLCKDGMCLSAQALRQALAEAHRACGDDMSLEVRPTRYVNVELINLPTK
jgi:Ca2+-binding EF-hand superfamily protein